MTNIRAARSLLILPALAVVALGIVGCSHTNTGSPTTPSSTDTATTSTGGGASTSSINPCSLLNAQNVQSLGLINQTPVNTSQSRGCRWDKNGNYGVEIDVRDHQGLSDINKSGETVTTNNVGNHDGVQFSDGLGCTVAMGVTNSSRVDVQVSDPGSQSTACQLAGQFATIVEPQLPAEQK